MPFWPIAAWRDTVFSSRCDGVDYWLRVCSSDLQRLGTSPDPSDINANPMPDWYFWWYFAILSMLPPQLETFVILGLPVVGLLGLIVVPMIVEQRVIAHHRDVRGQWARLFLALLPLVVLDHLWLQKTLVT